MAYTKKSALTQEEGQEEFEMSPGVTEAKSADEFDPGIIFGMTNILPELPSIPGYHCAWAPVKSDVIADPSRWIKMYQLGYRPITIDEFTTYGLGMVSDTYREKDNPEFSGCIKVMDVVAVKIPTPIYQKLTKYLEDQVGRTEADLKRRPTQMTKNVPFDHISVEHRVGTSNNLQSAYDKL